MSQHYRQPPRDLCTPVMRRILADEDLDRIELLVRPQGVIAYAYPSMLHPVVADRRCWLLKKAETAAELQGYGEPSPGTRSAIEIEALGAVANARGKTLGEALDVLETALAAAKGEQP